MDTVAKKELGEAMAAAMTDQQLVRGATRVMNVLDRHGLLVKQQLQPDMVGVHHQNRDGLGVHAMDVMELITGIAQVGWDDSVPSPICIEVCTDGKIADFNQQLVSQSGGQFFMEHPVLQVGWDDSVPSPICIEVGTDGKIADFNQQLVSQSGGAIPPYPPGQPRYASIACSHTNACLRAILHGAPGVAGAHDDIMVAGKLSVDLLRSKDPKFAEACQSGLTWKIISQVAVSEFADLPSLIQSASNCTGQPAKGEHEVQLMRRIWNTIQVCLANKKMRTFNALGQLNPEQVAAEHGFKAFVNPFFFVKSTPFAEDANVELHPQPFSPEDFNKDGKIPVIRNTVALKAGDELVVYLPQAKTDEPEELQPVPCNKRQRTKKSPAP
eukprot:s2257_g9.t1